MPRGSLRIYLGAAPGVGKTFAMLNEGNRRADRGADVVVGVAETNLAAGLARTAVGDCDVSPSYGESNEISISSKRRASGPWP